MKALLTDPVLLIASGALVAGLIALAWAIKKWNSMGTSSPESAPFDDMLSAPPAVPDLGLAPPLTFPTVMIGGAAPPPVSKEVADRLDTMSQRLLEMQTVLAKQSSGAAPGAGAAAPSGAVGQGFSPETVDKLLKIIGNVIQQVDTLQKSLNIPK